MVRLTSTVASGLALLSIGLASLVVKHTSAQVPPRGTFTATQACPATQRINDSNPDNTQLEVGEIYNSLGFNNQQGQFIQLRVGSDLLWVSADCGTFQPSSSPIISPDGNGGSRQEQETLALFFDNNNNPVDVDFPPGTQKDVSPSPPNLEPFDERVLDICGEQFDASVDRSKFEQLMKDFPDVLEDLQNAVGGELKPGRRTDDKFREDLTDIWFASDGFKHIFCGEKDGTSIGGLHFVGRYKELQDKNIARLLRREGFGRKDTVEEVVDGVIYTMGAAILDESGAIVASHRVKGYPLVRNAQELLLDATTAYKIFRVPRNPREDNPACLYTISDPAAPSFQALFVRKGDGIRTFFPDATPDTSGSNNDGSCEG